MMMKRKIIYSLFAAMLVLSFAACGTNGRQEKKAKYVFYVIGDGMGSNHVTLTQMYKAEIRGKIAVDSLSFTGFPELALATTYSATNAITCSAAAGTALATGFKTSAGTIGMDTDRKQALYSIADKAKKAGRKVGVTTSVSIDHATPAAFYAHQPDRDMYYQIGFDAIAAGFDLYAGAGFLQNKNPKDSTAPALFPALETAGYTLTRGYDDFKTKSSTADKIVLIEKEGRDKYSLANAIDRKEDDLTLPQIVEGSIDFLSKKSDDKGFFLMIEGGKIDWLCHAQDGGSAIREVEDLSEAMKKVIAFYNAHKEETLIVVTADHETGGLGLGKEGYTLNLKAFGHQKVSKEVLSKHFANLQKEKKSLLTWEEVKTELTAQLGFWKDVQLNEEQEGLLKKCYEASFIQHKGVIEKTMYTSSGAMATLAVKILNDVAKIGWTTYSHTSSSVPVYAIGVGADKFNGLIDNTDIPKRMASSMGIEL